MKRWEVTLIVNGQMIKHVIKHVVRAGDEERAAAKASRAHNGKVVVAGVKRLGDGE